MPKVSAVTKPTLPCSSLCMGSRERGGIGPLMMCGRGAEAAASISSAGHGGHKAGGWWHCGGEGGQCWGPSAASSPAG